MQKKNNRYRSIAGIFLIGASLTQMIYYGIMANSWNVVYYMYPQPYIPQVLLMITGVLLMCPLPDLVPGIGFFIVALQQLSTNRSFVTILVMVCYLLLAEALILKKLPIKYLKILYPYIMLFSVIYMPLQYGFFSRPIIEIYADNLVRTFANAFLVAGISFTGFAAAARENDDTLHPVGFVGIGATGFGLLIALAITVVCALAYQQLYVFDGYPFTGALWRISYFLYYLGLVLIPLLCLPRKSLNVSTNVQENPYLGSQANPYPGVQANTTGSISQSTERGANNMGIQLGREYVFKNGQIKVYEDRVVITHRGFRGAMTNNFAGEKAIPMGAIQTVQLREGTTFVRGYLQFGIMGEGSSNGGTFGAVGNENSVLVACGTDRNYTEENANARAIKEYVEKKIFARMNNPTGGNTVIQQTSAADDLKKFKELLDSGVISQEEFDAKKKQLLGL